MANNLAWTPGSGATVLTHDNGTAHIQIVKLGNSDQDLLTGASVSAAASGDNTLVAAVALKVIRVYRLQLVISGTVTVKFLDGAAGSTLNGLGYPMLVNGSITLDFDGEAWFKTTAGNAFVMNLSGAIQVSGRIWYTQI